MDLIACVYPHKNIRNREVEAIKASSRYVPPRRQSSEKLLDRIRRESTEPLEVQYASTLDYLPCIELRFSNIPQTNRGLVFGRSPNCDVILDYQGISACHFSLTFDEMKRLIIKDWNSLTGTEVLYDDRGEGKRRKFQWIIGGDKVPQKMENIIVLIGDNISFKIVAIQYDIKSQEYVDKVNRFCRGRATSDLFSGLILAGRETQQATNTGRIYLKKQLGKGTYGVVTHYWNVSDGTEFALKKPRSEAIRKRLVNHDAWANEARIMSNISHRHIVSLLGSNLDPLQLFLEYMPYGSLEGQDNISISETQSILDQCLSALIYLHEHNPPIAHRDIKPGNILIQNRSPIFIKFGDFGIARDSDELMTICGTLKYLAPEIYLQHNEASSYTVSVDIWSLGVVGCELIFGLPLYEKWYVMGGIEWSKEIIRNFQLYLERHPNELGQFVLNNMVVISPDMRSTARECYELLGIAEDGDQTPRPDSYIEEAETDSHAIEVFQQPPSFENGNVAVSSYAGARSGAPSPDSLPPKPKTYGKRVASSSSSDYRSSKRRHEVTPSVELAYFLADYSDDPLNALYVGSSVAPWIGLSGVEALSDWVGLSDMEASSDWVGLSEMDAGTCVEAPSDWDTIGSARQNQAWDEAPASVNAVPLAQDDDYDAWVAAVLLQAMSRGV